ncbi:hypothetical protein [Falsiroseomonas sp.]|uniref:hypothetical protein n=1 Tax=Falsiroseomonas sp. TaxID=2870721 RepID=UPI003561C45D
MSRPVQHDDGPLLAIAAELLTWRQAQGKTEAFEKAFAYVLALRQPDPPCPKVTIAREQALARLWKKQVALAAAIQLAEAKRREVENALRRGDTAAALATGRAFVGPAGLWAGPALPSLLGAPAGTFIRTRAAFAEALRALATDIEAGAVDVGKSGVGAELTALLNRANMLRKGGSEKPMS